MIVDQNIQAHLEPHQGETDLRFAARGRVAEMPSGPAYVIGYAMAAFGGLMVGVCLSWLF